MNKNICLFLIGLSMLTFAIVVSLGQVSIAIKQAAQGQFSYSNPIREIPVIVYIMLFLTGTGSLLLCIISKIKK